MYKKFVFLFTFLFLVSSNLFGTTLEFVTKEQIKKVELIYGEEGKKRLLQFNKMLQSAQYKSILTKLKLVNNFFNTLTYKQDKIHWKEKDYWASPFEFIGSGAGDCEDYAIAKYFALRLIGIDSSKLKITYVLLADKSKKDAVHHVVLNYYHNPKLTPVVLDNINKKIQLATKRKDIKLYRTIDIAKVMSLQKLFWS